MTDIYEEEVLSNTLYQNPENTEEIIERLKKCEKHYEVIELINETFPKWILGCYKKYSKDFPQFQNNWEYICKKNGCAILNIIIVDKIVFNNPKYSLIKIFCDLLTVFGHSVRRKEEFIGCKICDDALPSEKLYTQLVERKMTTFNCWMIKCRDC